MNEAQHQHPRDDALIGAARLHSRHVSLMTRLAAGAFYGVVAGALLHDHASIAGAVMVAVWTATVWLPTSIRAPGEARTPQ
jgi:hypothetical protein